jgi:hypothetical protein
MATRKAASTSSLTLTTEKPDLTSQKQQRGRIMALSDFAVVHARTDGEEHTVDAPLIHCFDGRQLVLAFVERTALADYFRMARRPGMRVSNLIALKPLRRL